MVMQVMLVSVFIVLVMVGHAVVGLMLCEWKVLVSPGVGSVCGSDAVAMIMCGNVGVRSFMTLLMLPLVSMVYRSAGWVLMLGVALVSELRKAWTDRGPRVVLTRRSGCVDSVLKWLGAG